MRAPRPLLALSVIGAVALRSAPTAVAPVPAAATPLTTRSVSMLPSVDTSLLHGLRFRMVGPPRGGRVTTVTGVPSQPRTFYMGVASGGLFRTTDAGASWMPITDGKVPVASTGSVAVAESDPNVIYLGTGSDDIRSNVSTGRGVYKSTDGGQTWSFAGLYECWADRRACASIRRIRTSPGWRRSETRSSRTPSAACSRRPTAERRGGRCCSSPTASARRISSSIRRTRTSSTRGCGAASESRGRSSAARREGGFYKSTDGGEHFTKITGGLPTELIGKANLAVTAANPNRVYALVEAKPGGGLYRSEDAGQSWKLISSFAQLITRPFYYVDARRRSDERRRRVRRRRELLQVDRRRRELDDRCARRTATTTTCGSIRRTAGS